MLRPAESKSRPTRIGTVLVLMAAAFASGCSSAPSGLGVAGSPTFLGAAPAPPEPAAARPAAEPRISAGKVLSAIAFERVTGYDVDPARLIER
jgi:hypothetical protein